MKLSIVASNKNRLDVNGAATKIFLRSLQWQIFRDFQFIIADGGSDNYDEILNYAKTNNADSENIKIKVVQHKIGDVFLRSLLNNVGIRNSDGDYVLTTDVDMIFRSNFTEEIVKVCNKKRLVEAKCFHLRDAITKKIHDGKIDPLSQFDFCIKFYKHGRASSSPGGCQCMHKDNWNAIRGFDETYYGWGSEDRDLLKRAKMYGLREFWAADSKEDLLILHQNHPKNQKRDMKFQAKNKQRLLRANKAIVNDDGWGGMK